MCQENNKFIFCTCLEKETRKEEHIDYYTWSLTKFISSRKSSIRGKIVRPKKNLGNEITSEKILNQLNTENNSFDFDYVPSERDSLRIEIYHPIERYRYLSLIFIDNKWQEGLNNIFTSITERIASGRIKRSINKNESQHSKGIWVSNTKSSIESLFTNLLRDDSIENQWNYIKELVDRKPAECFNKGLSLISSDLLNERTIGTRILVKLCHEGYKTKIIFTALFELLKLETEEDIIIQILSAIDDSNEIFDEDQIIELSKFKERNDNIKSSLLDALSKQTNEKAIDVLIELSQDKNPEIRERAVDYLGETLATDAKIKKALWSCVSDKNQEVSFYAILALSRPRYKDDRIKDVLIRKLENIDEENGHILVKSVEILNDKSLSPQVEELIRKNKEINFYSHKRLLEILNNLK